MKNRPRNRCLLAAVKHSKSNTSSPGSWGGIEWDLMFEGIWFLLGAEKASGCSGLTEAERSFTLIVNYSFQFHQQVKHSRHAEVGGGGRTFTAGVPRFTKHPGPHQTEEQGLSWVGNEVACSIYQDWDPEAAMVNG